MVLDDDPLAQDLLQRLRHDPAILAFLDPGSGEGVWIRDLEPPGRLWLSPGFRELFAQGEAVDEAGWQAALPPDDRKRLDACVARCIEDGTPYEEEVRYRRPDGSVGWVRCRGMSIRAADGRALRLVGAHTDMTTFRRLAEDRDTARRDAASARARADAAGRAKSEFLSRMSHEIRTPLSGVMGMLELLSNTDLDGEQRRHLAVARQSAETLLGLVNGVLDLSKLHVGAMTLSERPFDGALVFNHALSIMESRASAHDLEFVTAVDPSARRALHGDPDRLAQILYNLVSNAIKFTPRGRVAASVACRERPGESARLDLEITVTDTGIGISDADRQRIFDRFSQGDERRARRYEGTGLGLAIVRELLDLMGGTIALDSEPGEGSTFRCIVPVGVGQGPSDAPADPRPEVESALRGRRLLVAEDNAGNRHMIGSILDLLGCEFDMVASGEEAVAAAVACAYDGVLMDIQMPVLDGLEATRRLRADPRVADTLPIIGISANVLSQDVERAWRAGMNDHIGKPFSLDGFRSVLERYLGEGAAPDPRCRRVRLFGDRPQGLGPDGREMPAG